MMGKKTTLSSIVKDKGLQTGPFGSQLKANEYTDKGIPVVMPKDISGGRVVETSIVRTSEKKAASLKKHLLREGDILFPRRGDLGRIGVASKENVGWICGTGCLRARIKDEISVPYIHQYVQLSQVREWLESNALGQTMLNLNTEIISKLPIYLPTASEQPLIADLLSEWDTAIEKTEALIRAKQQQFLWLISTLISANQCSNKWENKHLGDIFDIHTYSSKSSTILDDGERLIVDMGSISRIGELIPTKQTNSDQDRLQLHDLIMPKDDIGGGNIIGKVALIDSNKQYICGDHVYRLVQKENNDAHFLRFLINSPIINRHLRARANGTSQLGLGKKDVIKQQVWLPPLPEQQRIAHILNTAQAEVRLLQQLAEAYRSQKRGLMQKLLTGEWTIPI